MHTVAEFSAFTRRADALLSPADRKELIDTLAFNPLAGDVIRGLGGIRKLRFASQGRGKSGAFRVIYYVLTENMPILALMIYGKNEQSDLSPAQRRVLLDVVNAIKGSRR